MFEHLRGLLRGAAGQPAATPAHERTLAAAVLVLEIARADYDRHEAELATLREGLAREFGIGAAALDALLAEAELRAKQSVSLYDFVQTLNRSMTQDDKRGLLRLLWDVAHADGRVDPQEEHLLRKIADLLHLSHADFIRGKLAAAEKSGN